MVLYNYLKRKIERNEKMMKKKRNVLKGIILCALMAILLAVPHKNADAASTSKEVKTSWVKSGSYRVRVKSGKLYKKGVSKAIDSNVYCAYVSGNTVVYAANDQNNYVDGNRFKTYNLKTGARKTFYKDVNEVGAVWMNNYNKGYAYALGGGEAGWGALYKINIKTGKIKEVNIGVKYSAYLQEIIYKQYIVLNVSKDGGMDKTTLCAYNTATKKSKKIASNVVCANVIGGKLYYAVAGKVTDEGIGNATIYRCSLKGTGKKTVARLNNIQTYTLAISKTNAIYRNAKNKLTKYTYSSKKASSCSGKTYNKVKKTMGTLYYYY